MSLKRIIDDAGLHSTQRCQQLGSTDSVPSKTKRVSASCSVESQARTDPDYGQKGALPYMNTDDGVDDLSLEAMAYLRQVRIEADSLPSLFVGQSPSFHRKNILNKDIFKRPVVTTSNTSCSYGKYSQGTYYSSYTTQPELIDSEDNVLNVCPSRTEITAMNFQVPARTGYHIFLIDLFAKQSARVVEMSKVSLEQARAHSNFPSLSEKAAASCDWANVLQSTQPKLREVAFFSRIQALRLIETASWLVNTFQLCQEDASSNLHAWIWALLCRVGEPGVLNSDEIYIIRELGKRVRLVLLSLLKDRTGGSHRQSNGQYEHRRRNSSSSIESAGEKDPILEEAKSRLIARYGSDTLSASKESTSALESDIMKEMPSTSATFIALDIILILIGEVFGQRDLLETAGQFWESSLHYRRSNTQEFYLRRENQLRVV